MWSLSRAALALTPLLALAAMTGLTHRAEAQSSFGGNNPYYFNNQSYSYGLQLPQVPQPNGQDEVRAAESERYRYSIRLQLGSLAPRHVESSSVDRYHW